MRRQLPMRGSQRGQTLISMMVGLVISLLTIGAMLALYKVVIEVTGSASHSAQRDGQVASALLAAQIEMQQAGFRTVPAVGPGEDFSVPEDLLWVSAPNDATQVVAWRHDGSRCGALVIRPADQTAEPEKVDIYLEEASCGNAETYGQALQAASALAGSRPLASLPGKTGFKAAEDAGRIPLESAYFAIEDGCSLPYAQQTDAFSGAPRLALKYPRVNAAEADYPVVFSVCLPNIVAKIEPSAAPPSGS